MIKIFAVSRINFFCLYYYLLFIIQNYFLFLPEMYLLQLRTERSRICSAGISIDSAMETCSMYPMYLSTNTLGTDTPCLHKTTKVMPTFAYPHDARYCDMLSLGMARVRLVILLQYQ